MEDRAAPYVLAAGETRRDDAILPFKALATDTGGLLSVCEFTLGAGKTGPVLHRHDAVDEAFYVVAGRLEAQLDDRRVQVAAGGFLWVPRGTAHTFANAGPDPVHVLALRSAPTAPGERPSRTTLRLTLERHSAPAVEEPETGALDLYGQAIRSG